MQPGVTRVMALSGLVAVWRPSPRTSGGLRPRSEAVPAFYSECSPRSMCARGETAPAGQPRPCTPLRSGHTLLPVAHAWLFHSHSSAIRSAVTRLTFTLRCHDPDVALGPAPRPSARTRSHTVAPLRRLHCAAGAERICRGHSPLHGAWRSRRLHHSHTGAGLLMRQCPEPRPTLRSPALRTYAHSPASLAQCGPDVSGVALRPRAYAPTHIPPLRLR